MMPQKKAKTSDMIKKCEKNSVYYKPKKMYDIVLDPICNASIIQ